MDEAKRFRQALKSPMVVVALCVIAGIAVYANIMESTTNTVLPVSVASAPPAQASAQAFSKPLTKKHDAAATQWIENPRRDPFAPVSIAKWSKSSSEESTKLSHGVQLNPQKRLNQFELKAIALEARHRSAVINRSVVYEGEMIEGYQVMSIQPKGVWLKHQGNTQWLTFSEKTAS